MERLKIVLGSVVFFNVFIGCIQKETGNYKDVEDEKLEQQDIGVKKYQQDDLKVYNLATQIVVESLQEPRTAEFPPTQERLEHIRKLGDNKYRIGSWVDSRDTYAAMTRKKFSLIFSISHSQIIKEKFEIESIGKIPEVKYHKK